MAVVRLEVRLEPGRRQKLLEIAAGRRTRISEIIREMIDLAHEEVGRAERLRAAEELGRLEVEEVPDPETLSRQLDDAHASPDLYRR